ncbi:MAG: 5-formyltetrahydrofolate cyclo-ligase [Cohaesibacter sp.]|nr:5-formyltetrahydrofolate cyclo-ligase [Cohaesibacter sp.]
MDDASLANEKQMMRRDILGQRDALPEKVRKSGSERAAQFVLSHLDAIDLPKGSSIGLFWPIRSEIDCALLAPMLRERGYELALPVVIGLEQMEFRRWLEGDALEPAGYGSMGPAKGSDLVVPHCLILPLAAFDQSRHRLGYGGGFYDRYIEKAERDVARPVLIGLAYDMQKVDRVPVGRYDQPLDRIVSDLGVV